jgi:hypothetical protein
MGGITASNWKGRNVYKQKVPATNASKTPAQQAQRRKFAVIAKLAGNIGPALRIGYNGAASKVTEQNAFITANFSAVSDNGTVATISYPALKMSTGTVGIAEVASAVYNATTGIIVVDLVDNSNGTDALPSDQAKFVIINTVTSQTFIPSPTVIRSDGANTNLDTAPGMVAANLRVFTFMKRATSTATSPSITQQAT